METTDEDKLEPSSDRSCSPPGNQGAITEVSATAIVAPSAGLLSEAEEFVTTSCEFDFSVSTTIAPETLSEGSAQGDAALSSDKDKARGNIIGGQGDEGNPSVCDTDVCWGDAKVENISEMCKVQNLEQVNLVKNTNQELDSSLNVVAFRDIVDDHFKMLDNKGDAGDKATKFANIKLESNSAAVKLEDIDVANEEPRLKLDMEEGDGMKAELEEDSLRNDRVKEFCSESNDELCLETQIDEGIDHPEGSSIKLCSRYADEMEDINCDSQDNELGHGNDVKEIATEVDGPATMKLETNASFVQSEDVASEKRSMKLELGEENNIKGEKEIDSVEIGRGQEMDSGLKAEVGSESQIDEEAVPEDSDKKQLSVDADEMEEIDGDSRENEVDDGMASGEDEIDELEDKNKGSAVMETEESYNKLEARSTELGHNDKGEDFSEVNKIKQNEKVEGDGSADGTRISNGKRKRGKGRGKTNFGPSPKKKIEEDVCFICFDGGDLVLCDRRGCPKAYHPSCVNHDEAFFRTKGRWNCGWHQCSVCQRNASHYMCFTCTFSLCKGCIKDGVIFCVRGSKGLCETCFKNVSMIENSGRTGNESDKVDFDDKSSWEYLFKDYWTDLRDRLSISSEEIVRARNPWKGIDSVVSKPECSDEFNDANVEGGSGSESSLENIDMNKQKKKKGKKRLKSSAKYKDSPSGKSLRQVSSDDGVEWASKELLELVMHMKNGDASVCTQFDVQALLLEYITKNKLRDPRRKSQIICDFRLQNLFGKPRVGHFEMLKLLESHFLLKEEESLGDDLRGSDAEMNQLEGDGNTESLAKTSKDKKRKSRKKSDSKVLRSNIDDYAAIDIHNINLIYLRRSLVEYLLNDPETFHDKVVGAFVRLRIPGSAQKQDLYRLVQVVGTSKKADTYRVGKKTTNYLLEILNLNKKEIVSIDIISNQEFTEDECKRLRQSVKCGLINPFSVGAIHEKAIALQSVRVQDSLEAEITRLSHLRDRASDMGRRKELRECVEKLFVLRSHEERQRRLDELPEIHSDPKMDPSYESDDDETIGDDRRQDSSFKHGGGFGRRTTIEPTSPVISSTETWPLAKNTGSARELNRSSSCRGIYTKGDSFDVAGENSVTPTPVRDRELQHSLSWEKPKSVQLPEIPPKVSMETVVPSPTENKLPALPTEKSNETEKIWHYKDPSGKIQGPFSMVQLRKWSTTGYFPSDLKIWKSSDSQECSYLLTDALTGVLKVSQPTAVENSVPRSQPQKFSSGLSSPTKIDPPEKWNSGTNLPSPTPSGTARKHKSRWSPTQSPVETNSVPLIPQVQSATTAVGTPSFDVKTLQNLVQQVANTPMGTPGWVNPPAQKVEPNPPVPAVAMQPSNTYTSWASTPNTVQNNSTSWRPPPVQPQMNIQPPAPRGHEVHGNTTSWGPNAGWGPSPGWVPPMHGSAGWGPPMQGQGFGNVYQGWGQHGQAPPPVNPASGWMAPPPTAANANPSPGWSSLPPSSGNIGAWNSDFGHNGSGRPWNRPPAPAPAPVNREDPSRSMNKVNRVCKYHESGHCKKGSACDYMHT